MEKKYRLEPFNLERAKAGEPVCTREGKDVRIICYDRKSVTYPIIALVGDIEGVGLYSSKGEFYTNQPSISDLMMRVEVEEPCIYAEVAGEITPFEDVKAEEFIDLKSLEYLIIKTHDGKLLKVWKQNLPEKEWKKAQKVASEIGEGWRCPTRHECIDIYDARFKGLNDALEEIGGDTLEEIYWTSEADSDPQYYALSAVFFNGYAGYLDTNDKCRQYSVRPVCTVTNSETEKK